MIFSNTICIWVYYSSFTHNLESCNFSSCFRYLLESNFPYLMPSFIRTTKEFYYICN